MKAFDYVIQQGDSISSIAKKFFGTDQAQIALSAFNKIEQTRKLIVAATFQIPAYIYLASTTKLPEGKNGCIVKVAKAKVSANEPALQKDDSDSEKKWGGILYSEEGKWVENLQADLIKIGLLKTDKPDGKYGPKTQAAVKDFQERAEIGDFVDSLGNSIAESEVKPHFGQKGIGDKATRDYARKIGLLGWKIASKKIAHIYADVDSLEGTAKVGTKQCVELIKTYALAPQTSEWEEGDRVHGNNEILKGTAIATFVNGKYESKASDNHAAFYINQDANGLTIMDQWYDDNSKPKVSSRYIRRKGKNANNSYISASNNADAYSIILW